MARETPGFNPRSGWRENQRTGKKEGVQQAREDGLTGKAETRGLDISEPPTSRRNRAHTIHFKGLGLEWEYDGKKIGTAGGALEQGNVQVTIGGKPCNVERLPVRMERAINTTRIEKETRYHEGYHDHGKGPSYETSGESLTRC